MTPPENVAGTLVLAGSGTALPGSPSAETVVLGLPLVRRTALAAFRAGFDRVYVLAGEGAAAGTALEATGARMFPRDAAELALPPGRIVLLPDRVVASPQWLRSLREAPAEPGSLHRLGAGAIVQTPDPAPLARALARQSSLSGVMSDWSAALPAGAPIGGVAVPLEVTTDSELAAAETLLLKGLVKKQDGILTRFISRKISLAVTRRLAPTRVTPNMMTLVCLALGLAAAWSFASPALPRQIAGGLLFLLHSILDGCDGELSRLKFQESRLGGLLDFWGDNLVHVAVFSAFALAWSTASGQSWPLVLGALAVSGTVLSSGFIYNYAMRPRAGGGSLLTTASHSRQSRMARVLDAVSGRDFIYIVMVLALFGKAYWFLASAAVGTPGFFVAALVAALGSRRREAGTTTPSASGPSSPDPAR
jgi:phosphatidylglycerophosphate synthase